MREKLVNNASSTLSAAVTSTTATALVVASAAAFPSAGNFRVIVDSEIMTVTAVSGTTFTVARAQDGTAAATHASGASVIAILTAGSLQAYGRNNVPYFDGSRPVFGIYDASGNILTKASFTAVNTTYATLTDNTDGSISVVKTKLPSTVEDVTLLTRAAPATPYSVVACLDGILLDPNHGSGYGLAFYNSSNQMLTLLSTGMNFSGFVPTFAVYNFTNPTTFSASQVSRSFFFKSQLTWFKVADDGTNLSFYLSHNGIDWVLVTSVGRTSFITGGPTHVAAVLSSGLNTDYNIAATLLAWSGA